MKKIMLAFVVAVILALSGAAYADEGLASVRTVSAEALSKFRQHTASLREELEAKELELRNEYAYEGLNTSRIAELEEDIKEIKAKIRSVAASLNIEPCCCL